MVLPLEYKKHLLYIILTSKIYYLCNYKSPQASYTSVSQVLKCVDQTHHQRLKGY